MKELELKIPELLDHGPLVEAEIFSNVSSFLNIKNNKGFEKYSRVKLLIDTGSNISGLDKNIIDQLSLVQYMGDDIVNGVGGSYAIKRYSCILFLPIFKDKGLPIDILGGEYQDAPFQGILGRDVLQFCHFIYDGKNDKYTISAADIW